MFVKQPAQITLIRWRRGEATSVCPLSGAKRKLLKSRIVRLWPKADILPWRESDDLPRIGHRREPFLGGDMQRGGSGQPVKGQRQRTKSETRKVPTARASIADRDELLDRRTRGRGIGAAAGDL